MSTSTLLFKNMVALHTCTLNKGLEGGVQTVGGKDLECFAWIVIYNGKSFGYARTASFRLPHVITKLVNEGMELGDADDTVFNTVNSVSLLILFNLFFFYFYF